ncbi:MAG: hypothetical protein ABSG43_09455 [Solirubrobacteraceae bacterium]
MDGTGGMVPFALRLADHFSGVLTRLPPALMDLNQLRSERSVGIAVGMIYAVRADESEDLPRFSVEAEANALAALRLAR